MGIDAVFSSRSRLHNPAVALGDYYNVSNGRELNQEGLPFGFFHHPLPHRPRGYPMVFEADLLEGRMRVRGKTSRGADCGSEGKAGHGGQRKGLSRGVSGHPSARTSQSQGQNHLLYI